MILTPWGYVEFVRARELIRDGQTPAYAYFKDGRRYTLERASLVGIDQIRLDGAVADNNPGARLRGTLRVGAGDTIPIIRKEH